MLHKRSIICNNRVNRKNSISNNFADCYESWSRFGIIENGTLLLIIGRFGSLVLFCFAMAVHIGKEIKAELHRQERGATWLAQRLHCDRTNVYNIFKREGIDTRLLERICIILNRNFFSLYCQEDNSDVENNATAP